MKYDVKDSLNDSKSINKINNRCTELHITQAFSQKIILKIITKYNNIKIITVSRSTKERLSDATKKLLRKNKIKLYTKKEQGRPISISIVKLNKILHMYKDYSYRELAEKLDIPKSTIHYLIKKSKRRKIKDGNKIIYLK
jgi:hypothetical protein